MKRLTRAEVMAAVSAAPGSTPAQLAGTLGATTHVVTLHLRRMAAAGEAHNAGSRKGGANAAGRWFPGRRVSLESVWLRCA